MSRSFVAAPRFVAEKAADAILAALKQYAPEHSHRMKAELSYTLTAFGTGFVARFYGPFYTKWVIEGRGEVWAGIFTGKSNKKFLHFWIEGKEIFTTHVRAAAPNDFRIPAMVTASPPIEAVMHEAGVRTIRGELAATTVWG